MKVILGLALLVVAVSALQPPTPSNAFTASISFTVSDHQHQESYFGTMYHDAINTMQLVDIPSDSIGRLERWDKGRVYQFNYVDPYCTSATSSDRGQANLWGWLRSAAWKGNYIISGVTCQQWEYTYGDKHWAGCFAGNTPVALAVASSAFKMQYYFYDFNASAPSSSIFTVPNYCSSRRGFEGLGTSSASKRASLLLTVSF